MSKAKTKPEPAAEQPPADDPTAIMLGYLALPVEGVVQGSDLTWPPRRRWRRTRRGG